MSKVYRERVVSTGCLWKIKRLITVGASVSSK